MPVFLDACDNILLRGGKVVHFVTVQRDYERFTGNIGERQPRPAVWETYDLAWDTLENWRDTRPAHYWIAVNEARSLGGV